MIRVDSHQGSDESECDKDQGDWCLVVVTSSSVMILSLSGITLT